MSHDPELPPLPPDIAALLDDARAVPEAPRDARRQVAARLAATTGLAVSAATVSGAQAAMLPLKVLALVSVVSVGVAFGVRARPTPAPPAPRTAVTHRAPREVTAPAPVAPVVPVAPVAPVVPVAPPPRTRTVAAPHSETAPRDTLVDELPLIDDAQRALARGDGATCLDAVRAHQQHFTAGSLSPERDALRVQCLALSGDLRAAESARARFHQRHPGSVLGAAVDRAVTTAPR